MSKAGEAQEGKGNYLQTPPFLSSHFPNSASALKQVHTCNCVTRVGTIPPARGEELMDQGALDPEESQNEELPEKINFSTQCL